MASIASGMKRITLFHNPGAGEEAFSQEELTNELRRAGYEVHYQSSIDDDFANALQHPTDLIVIAGGDGTIRYVALELIGNNTPIAVLPMGTANNIAGSLAIGGAPGELIAGWSLSNQRSFGIGQVSGYGKDVLFMEAVGIGLFARMMKNSKRLREQKQIGDVSDDKYTSALHLLQAMIPDYTPHECTVTIDGKDFSGAYLLVEVMNISCIGPNLHLAPKADPGDGWFDVVLVTENERDVLSEYVNHRVAGKPQPVYLPIQRGKEIQITCTDAPIHVDDQFLATDPNQPEEEVQLNIRYTAQLDLVR